MIAFIGVGSNLGDRKATIDSARQMLGRMPGVKMLRSSVIHETEPVGGPPQGPYLNAVWEVETTLSAGELLDRFFQIEKKFNRFRTQRNAPRTLDLDLLFYGDSIIQQKGLTVPHPRLHERLFVLVPLMELAPDWVHPILNKTVRELIADLQPSQLGSVCPSAFVG
ncbi:MAG: 2-amino-4-hydroxy-6-hydroxymethyldihydropteridine diphosphokinase, partial [Candidatus Omnitrophica bacterium]|nr:2-amino-4-hydroxy-6-hydroxymethyldihydropteridine diphosphokinase [Candidatus Omnitrophota bacterium]